MYTLLNGAKMSTIMIIIRQKKKSIRRQKAFLSKTVNCKSVNVTSNFTLWYTNVYVVFYF